MRKPWTCLLAALAGLAFAGAADAQRLPVVGQGPVGAVLGDVRGDLGAATRDVAGDLRTAEGDLADLSQARLDSLRALVRANPHALDLDAHGQAIVRGEVMAIDPAPDALERALRAGFSVLRESALEPLGLKLVILAPPDGVAAREGLRRLRKLDPGGQYDVDHIYAPSGGAAGPSASAGEPAGPKAGGAVVGMLDSGVDAGHAALAGEIAVQQGFAPGGVVPAAHGTAVASLIAGRGPKLAAAAPGARLVVADVYGSGPTGGSAEAIARALAFMAQQKVRVINISLVGPANLTVQAAVRASIAHGEMIVAPVGNDGPAAPPLYPASYPGVIAVTGVDGRGRPLPEAGRALHVDFAAAGADVLAAQPGGGYGRVRGTSFAAPIVAGRLALLLKGETAPSRALAELAGGARSAHGDRWLGRGVVSAGGLRAAD
ncbi:S8 family serine peptidase [Phenylobacterium montanum]|nr:S8 family serine peptidase [Caulobacter sp. S6]